jgi:hypothetical protein
MQIEKIIIKTKEDFCKIREISILPDLFLVFGSIQFIQEKEFTSTVKTHYPNSLIFGCSTCGEISDTEVLEKSMIITAIQFSSTQLILESVAILDAKNSYECGKLLREKFPMKNLKHLMILSDGVHVNGSYLLEGIQNKHKPKISITGGLAGDDAKFLKTLVFDKNGEAKSKCISALGFYGDAIQVGYGTNGGWSDFGLERVVTRSKDNVLYELDHQPALLLYKQFLGERAKELPLSGMVFPLSLQIGDSTKTVIRTVHGINEEDQSLIFGGNIPENAIVKLMKANVDLLVAGAKSSAIACNKIIPKGKAELAILISCVGRQLVLKQLVEEEVEVVANEMGDKTCITGFYSYGELSPFEKDGECYLHNQTMTVSTFSEK